MTQTLLNKPSKGIKKMWMSYKEINEVTQDSKVMVSNLKKCLNFW